MRAKQRGRGSDAPGRNLPTNLQSLLRLRSLVNVLLLRSLIRAVSWLIIPFSFLVWSLEQLRSRLSTRLEVTLWREAEKDVVVNANGRAYAAAELDVVSN